MATATIRSIRNWVKDRQKLGSYAANSAAKVVEDGKGKASSWSSSKQMPCYNFLHNSFAGHYTVQTRSLTSALLMRLWNSSTNSSSATPGSQVLQSGREHCAPSSHFCGVLHTQAEAVAPSTSREVDELADIDWDGLGFGIWKTDYMYLMKCGKDGEFYEGDLQPFGTLELSPSAGVLNYGQGLFEGLKAFRTADGRIVLFRPEENALRLEVGAERLCMPAPSVEQFVYSVKQTVMANKRWIPPSGKGALYIRVLLMGSGPVLGLAPAPEVTFLIFVSPVGNYYKEGLSPIHLQVETKHHRATPGGTGGIKSIGNYGPVLRVQRGAKARGFSDVLYVDSINKKYIEEVSSCNIFVVKDNIISTPALHGTILPGITRKSIIALACSRGYEVQERLVSVDELLAADEVFCTGTAVVLSAVGSITYLDKKATYRSGAPGAVSEELYSALTSIQLGLAEDSMGWIVELK